MTENLTHSSTLLAYRNNAPDRLTKGSNLLLYRKKSPSRLTQAANLLLYLQQKYMVPPEPGLEAPYQINMEPEIPVVERWQYYTAIFESVTGHEQRNALRAHPRYFHSFTCLIADDDERRATFNYLMRYLKNNFLFPMYQYATSLSQDVPSGTTRIYYNPSMTDIRAGDNLAFYDQYTNVLTFGQIVTTEVDGANIEALPIDIGHHCLVMPAQIFSLPSGASISMNSVDGSVTFDVLGMKTRPLKRPDVPNSLTYVQDLGDTLPVLNQRPLANDSVEENFDQGIVTLDNGVAFPDKISQWSHAKISGEREFVTRRFDGNLDMWREFFDFVKGKQKGFLFPSFRKDLELREIPILGANELVFQGTSYYDLYTYPTFRRLWIKTQNGYIYRRVTGASIVYEGSNEVGVRVSLNSTLGNSIGDNIFETISYLNTCRLNDDTLILEHRAFDVYIKFEMVTVDE
jgi:hypothetical protein